MTESHLLTTPSTLVAQISNCKLSTINIPRITAKNAPFTTIKAYKEFKKILQLIQPDIVHLHGAWDSRLGLMQYVAHHEGFVTIVSPYGAISPEVLNIDFFKKWFLPLFIYQAPMIRRSSSLIAISEKEWKDIRSLGLKKKVEIMPSTDLSQALMSAYHKAMDSSYRRFITPEEEQFVERCFIAATTEDGLNSEATDLASLTSNLNLRRIFFLAYDEDIMPQLREGAIKLHVDMPQPPQIGDVPRYIDRRAKHRGAIRELPLPRRCIRVADDKVDEYQVIVSLLRVQKIGINMLTYRHKAELYQLFRNLDFDEYVVARELSRLHLSSFTKKIQKLLHEMYNLPVGYNIY